VVVRLSTDCTLQIDRKQRISQRNCQTWVVESAEQLVREGIFEQSVVDYLLARKQYWF
jgi:hypothetical protein